MLKYVWTKFEILTPYISWDTVNFGGNFDNLPKNCFCTSMASLWVIYMGKTNFEKTSPKEFFDAFVMIWAWKSGFNSWNQNFWKCTLFVWSTEHKPPFLASTISRGGSCHVLYWCLRQGSQDHCEPVCVWCGTMHTANAASCESDKIRVT